jgi:acetate kinase
MRLLIVNAGSSSVKLRVLGPDDTVERTVDLPSLDDASARTALARTLHEWADSPPPDAVAHRVVHGGTRFTTAVRIDGDVRAALDDLTDLAPLHQPKSLAGVDAVSDVLPDVPGYACFDTAFHATIPAAAATYAVPAQWRDRYAIKRYGFHGLSHAYCAHRVRELLNRPGRSGRPHDPLRIVTCHLGAGASLTAIVAGRSVDTTMGFTPLEGVVMATRSGSVDPGLLLWLEEHEGIPPHEIAEALERRSGLLALSGSADLRDVEARREAGDARAGLAFDVYVHRLITASGAMTAAAGGLDAVAFTGGVGQNSAAVRSAVCAGLAHLGVAIDEIRNRTLGAGDTEITAADAGPAVLVIEAREDLQMAREVRMALR